MPANWITERPTSQRRMPAQAPRLELPVPRPAFEAEPEGEAEPKQARQAERGAVVVDFYI